MAARIKGKNIVFTLDAVDYKVDATSVVFTHEEADTVTFGDGGYEWKCALTGVQGTASDSLHTFFWDNTGETVDFVFAPHGNATPSASQPHYTGSITLPYKKPDIGGEAGSQWTFDMELDVDGDLTKVTSGA